MKAGSFCRALGSVIVMTLAATSTTAKADEPAAPHAPTARPATSANGCQWWSRHSNCAPPSSAAGKATTAPVNAAASASSAPAPAATPSPAPSSATPAPPSSAAPASAAPASPSPETGSPSASTPLTVRPSKPLATAPTHESTPVGYKVVVGLGVALAAGLWLKRRRGVQRPETKRSRIDVLGRTSVGVRRDLLVVDVEGMRLLLGATPSAIQMLAVLDTPDGAEAATSTLADEEEDTPALDDVPPRPEKKPPVKATTRAARESASRSAEAAPRKEAAVSAPPEPPDPVESVEALGDRVRSLLASRGTSRATKATSARRRDATKRNPVAGQAEGLRLALEASADDEPEPFRRTDW